MRCASCMDLLCGSMIVSTAGASCIALHSVFQSAKGSMTNAKDPACGNNKHFACAHLLLLRGYSVYDKAICDQSSSKTKESVDPGVRITVNQRHACMQKQLWMEM